MPIIFRKFFVSKQAVVFALTIGLLGFAGIWLLGYSTPSGLGLNDDSIAYIAGARSILAGQGYREAWLASNEPVTHFPPGFPAVLALIGFLTGLDPVRGARALNGLLFGLNIALTGWIGFRMTHSRIAGLLSAALVLSNSSLLIIHTRAMSEPLYIFLILLAFLLLDVYFEFLKVNLLVTLGFVLGWAYLARYAALSLLATMFVAMLVLHKNWRDRLKAVGVLALSAFPWIITWSIRNRIVGGSFTNRTLGWHPITSQNWRKARGTFADFVVPVEELQKILGGDFFEIFLISTGLALLLWVLVKGLPPFFKPHNYSRTEILSFANGLYVVAYLLVLVATMTLFDPATKFQVRILSPIYISLLLLLVALGTWLWRKRNLAWKTFIVLFATGLLGLFAYGQVFSVQNLLKEQATLANERWSESEAIAALNQLPSDVLVLTNEPGVIYFHTGRPSGILPKSEPGISNIKQPVLDGDAVIILFRVHRADDETLNYYYDLMRGLYLTDYSGAWMLSTFPE